MQLPRFYCRSKVFVRSGCGDAASEVPTQRREQRVAHRHGEQRVADGLAPPPGLGPPRIPYCRHGPAAAEPLPPLPDQRITRATARAYDLPLQATTATYTDPNGLVCYTPTAPYRPVAVAAAVTAPLSTRPWPSRLRRKQPGPPSITVTSFDIPPDDEPLLLSRAEMATPEGRAAHAVRAANAAYSYDSTIDNALRAAQLAAVRTQRKRVNRTVTEYR